MSVTYFVKHLDRRETVPSFWDLIPMELYERSVIASRFLNILSDKIQEHEGVSIKIAETALLTWENRRLTFVRDDEPCWPGKYYIITSYPVKKEIIEYLETQSKNIAKTLNPYIDREDKQRADEIFYRNCQD